MSGIPRPFEFDDRRSRRFARVAALSAAVAGLVLGAAYGGPAEPLALLAAALVGGVLHRQADYLRGPEAYGDAILAAFAGTALASLAVVGLVSPALGIHPLNVLSAVTLPILAGGVTVVVLALVGFVAGVALDALGVRVPDPAGIALLAGGAAAFVGLQYALGGLRPDAGALATGVVAPERFGRYQLYRVAGLVAGGLAFAGFRSLLAAPGRRRIGLAGVLVAGLVLGGVGVAEVQGRIDRSLVAAGLGDRVSATVTELGTDDGALRVTLRVENRGDRAVRLTGVHVRVREPSGRQLASGAGRPADAVPVVVEPGGSLSATYRVGLTPGGSERLRGALDRGGLVVSGRASFRVAARGGFAPGRAAAEFVVRFECSVENRGCT